MERSFTEGYTVELDGNKVAVWCDDKALLSGAVISCKIKDIDSKIFARAAALDIYTDDKEIKFRVRARESNSAPFPTNWNPFATGSMIDVNALVSLGSKLTDMLDNK